jgi:hypothetical protein
MVRRIGRSRLTDEKLVLDVDEVRSLEDHLAVRSLDRVLDQNLSFGETRKGSVSLEWQGTRKEEQRTPCDQSPDDLTTWTLHVPFGTASSALGSVEG